MDDPSFADSSFTNSSFTREFASLVNAPVQPPRFSAQDYHKVQAEVEDLLAHFKDFAPAMTEDQKARALSYMGIVQPYEVLQRNASHATYDVDQVSAQYALVQKIRQMVLDPANNFTERTDAKGLSALVNAINGTISLFMRHQESLDSLKEMRIMREAIIEAVKDLPNEVQDKFFRRLEQLRVLG